MKNPIRHCTFVLVSRDDPSLSVHPSYPAAHHIQICPWESMYKGLFCLWQMDIIVIGLLLRKHSTHSYMKGASRRPQYFRLPFGMSILSRRMALSGCGGWVSRGFGNPTSFDFGFFIPKSMAGAEWFQIFLKKYVLVLESRYIWIVECPWIIILLSFTNFSANIFFFRI